MPTSKLPEKLAVDANILLSIAIWGQGRTAVLFRRAAKAGVRFYTTVYTLTEIEKYLPVLADKQGIPLELARSALQTLPVVAITKTAYRHRMGQAEALIRDHRDAELLALAIELQLPVWSQDKDFKDTGFPSLDTGDMAALLPDNP